MEKKEWMINLALLLAGLLFSIGSLQAGFGSFHKPGPGFLPFFASIVLSLFAGFMLGVISIISGSKVATTALVFSIPILDVAWVIMRRLFLEGGSPFRGDRKHLHFRLLDIGLSHRKAVFVLYGITAYFGMTALFLQTRARLSAFVILSAILCILGMWLLLMRRIHKKIQK